MKCIQTKGVEQEIGALIRFELDVTFHIQEKCSHLLYIHTLAIVQLTCRSLYKFIDNAVSFRKGFLFLLRNMVGQQAVIIPQVTVEYDELGRRCEGMLNRMDLCGGIIAYKAPELGYDHAIIAVQKVTDVFVDLHVII